MADIAKAANLTEPGLLHHFPSKAHLLTAVLAERDRVDHERFDPANLDGQGDLLETYKQLVKHNETVPGLVQLFTTLAAESVQEDHPGHEFFKQRYQAAHEQITEILLREQEKHEIRSDVAAEDLAVMLYAMMDGLQIQWLYDPESADMARIFDQFVRLLRPDGQ